MFLELIFITFSWDYARPTTSNRPPTVQIWSEPLPFGLCSIVFSEQFLQKFSQNCSEHQIIFCKKTSFRVHNSCEGDTLNKLNSIHLGCLSMGNLLGDTKEKNLLGMTRLV